MRGPTWWLALLLGAAARGGAQVPVMPAGGDSAAYTWTTVTYRSGESIYIDAGTRAGLAPGSTAWVIRAGREVAQLVVAYVSSNRASCTLVRMSEPVVVGDSVRFVAPRVADSSQSGVTRHAVASRASRAVGALHGRLGVRYFTTRFSGGGSSALSQPAVDARLEGQELGGTPLGVVLDVRAHRTRSTGASSPPGPSTRVYQAAVRLDGAGGPGRVTLGRQFATALSPVGLFDGVAADFNWSTAGVGAFAGSQPEVATMGYSSAIREVGAYGRLHNAAGRGPTWSLTTGGVGSYAGSEVNREFMYVQGLVVTPVFSMYAAQEVDVNRGWKADAESRATTPTSTFATARLSLGPVLALNAGYDNRRNIRLYRDFTTPDVEFDDSFRQGMWGGVQLNVGSHVFASFDQRTSRGGAAGASDSWTATARLSRVTPLGLGSRIRLTRYEGQLLEGELRSASLEVQPAGRVRLELTAGDRADIRPLEGLEPARLKWLGADADFSIGRSLYLTYSLYREQGRDARMVQHFTSLTWRF